MIAKFFNALPLPDDLKIVTKNFSFLSLSQIMSFVMPFITMPYLIRVLGAPGFGLLAFAQALIQYFIVVIDYGFNFSVIKEISVNRNDSVKLSAIFSSLFVIRLVFWILSFIILVGASFFFLKVQTDRFVCILYMISIFGYAIFPTHIFLGLEKMKYIFYCNLIPPLFSLMVFIFVRSSQDLLLVPGLAVLGTVFSGAWGLSIACYKLKLRLSIPRVRDILDILKDGWQVFLTNISVVTFSSARTFAVGLFATYTVTGYYAVADRIAMLLNVFPLSLLCQAVYPQLSARYVQDKGKAGIRTHKIQNFVAIFYAAVTLLCGIFAPSLIYVFSGSSSQEAVTALRLLLIAILLIAVNAFRLQYCYVDGRKDVFLKLCFLGAAGTVSTFVLAAWFSYWGVAINLIIIAVASIFLTPSIKKSESL